MMFTSAFAQAAGTPPEPNMLMTLLPFVLIAVVFYFLLIRPQQKRLKEHRAMIGDVKRGDTVVTGGGFIGKVTKVIDDSDELEVDLGNDVKVRVVKSTIVDVRGKGQPVKADAANDKK
ncbi:preprotein translocase subunit YajC [Govanella unica]|uniref:Sec translocon accessory complex subunit YajC n=1 Tax=Govanella unica TaxID=2975056 RepID=A0A9X3TYA1_9PROT|nr:preprotein translocase subunit YajC [Govania unica]